MSKIRLSVTILMITALATSALPFFHGSDASRDGLIDLEDAILLTRTLAQDTETPDSSLYNSLHNTIKALKIVAGLESPPISQEDSRSKQNQTSPDYPRTLPYLNASPEFHPFFATHIYQSDYSYNDHSISLCPTPRPPKTAS